MYYSTVPPTLTIGGIVALLSTPFTVFLPLRRALNRVWERRYGPRFRGGDPLWYLRYLDEVRRFNERIAGRLWAISALSLLTVVAEGELSYQAAYAFADAVVEGGEPLSAFYDWAVLGMEALLAVYVATSVVIALHLVRTRDPKHRRYCPIFRACLPRPYRRRAWRTLRTLTVPVSILPVITGAWALRWGLWVLS